jgi:hypothetical protein
MFFLNGIVSSLGILMLQYFGGLLYQNWRKSAPFIIALACYALLTILTLVLGCMGKLKF